MAFNLLESAKDLISNELLSKAAGTLGESESGIARAASGILPSLIGLMADKASNHQSATAIARLAEQSNNNGILGNLGQLFGTSSGDVSKNSLSFITDLFGQSKLSSLVSLISNFAGVKNTSTSSLLGMVTPVIMGLLGKHAATNGLNAGNLASALASQKDIAMKALPSGLNLNSLFSPAATPAQGSTSQETEGKKCKFSWWWPLLLLALLALALWMLLGKGCKREGEAVVAGVDSLKTETTEVVKNLGGKLDSLTGDFIYDLGEMASIDLPNGGGKLEVGKNSTEYKLFSFLNDPAAAIDTVKGNWFEFTNVRFKTGGAEIQDESMAQLKNMVAIAKSFPKAVFKMGGYTDNTGDSLANVKLSQKRADAVVAQLIKMGVAKKSIAGAEGYGPQWPIGDNATAEGRAMNRRVAVRVKAK